MFGFKLKGDKKLFARPLKYIGPLFLVLVIIVAWYAHSRIYSSKHGAVVSAVEIRPIWNMIKEDIDFIWLKMTINFQKGRYHSPIFLYLVCILLVPNIVFFKKYNRLLSLVVFITLIQGILFTLLFYYSMGRCDYYQINNAIIPALIVLNFALFIKDNYNKIFNSIYTKCIISIILILLINDCRKVMIVRYSGWFYRATYPFVEKFGTVTPYLRSLGIERNDRVYSTPDVTTNNTLYLMNQIGNTDLGLPSKSKKENIEYLIPKGLKYFIVGDTSVYNEDLSPYLNNKIGEYMGIDIYKISD